MTQHFRAPMEDFSKAVWNGVRAHLAHPNAASSSSMKDSHQFCAVPAATALLPSYDTDTRGGIWERLKG